MSLLKSTFIENIFIQWLIHNRRSEAAVSIQTFQKRFAAKKKQSRFDFPTETSSQSVEYRPKLKFSEVHIWCLGCLKNFIVQNLAKYQNFVKKWESPLEPKNHVYPFRLYCNSLKKSTFWVVLVLSANKKFQLEYQRIWGGVSIYFKVFSSVQKCLWGFGQLTKFQLQICAERSKSYLRWISLINFCSSCRFNDHDEPMLLIFRPHSQQKSISGFFQVWNL